jgi:hypothetical protein
MEAGRTATVDTIHSRNDAWQAIYDATIEQARQQPPATVEAPGIRPTRPWMIATIALWALALVAGGVLQAAGSSSTLGGVVGAAAIVVTVIWAYIAHQNRGQRDTAQTQAIQAAEDTARARYGDNPSWHPRYTLTELDQAATKIGTQLTDGPREFPAPDTLLPLGPTYQTRPATDFPTDLPDEARQLLHVYTGEDEQQHPQ